MTRLSRAVVGVGGVVTALLVLPAGPAPAVAVLVATGLLLAGVSRGWDRAVTGGGGLLLAGVVFAGSVGLPTQSLVLATVTGLIVWDSGVNGAGLAGQLDSSARTQRAETARLGVTLVVAAGAGGVTLLTFSAGQGLVPPVALIPVAVGAVLVAFGLSPRTAD